MLKWRNFLLWLGEEESVEKSQEKQIDFSGRWILRSEDNELNWEIAIEIL